MCEFFGIAGELVPENTEQFVYDRLGNQELVFLFHDAPQSFLAAPAWEGQSRNQNVGVEDDLHSFR